MLGISAANGLVSMTGQVWLGLQVRVLLLVLLKYLEELDGVLSHAPLAWEPHPQGAARGWLGELGHCKQASSLSAGSPLC
jgi:hypothetical protein